MSDFQWLNDAARQFLERGYLQDGQTAEERIDEIATHFGKLSCHHEKGRKFYDYMARGYYSLSSPVWANYGTNRGLPVSCFGSFIDDNIPSIMQGVSEVGAMSKFGGGCSGYFGNIRPRGSEIGEGNGKTFGAAHFMELFETLTSVVSQGTVRRGFFSPYLPINHGDIEEFIDIGSEGHPIQGLTHGVTVEDDWMESMINGCRHKRKVWAKVLQSRKEKGYPYIMFKDNVNNNKPDVYKDKDMEIVASNMCVHPDTMILTDMGYMQIGLLEDMAVNVWNGMKFSPTKVRKTGIDEKMVTVKFSTGQEITCTDYHKFYFPDGTETRAAYLKEGDAMIKFDLPIAGNSLTTLGKLSYVQGFYSGDGCLVDGRARIYLYDKKIDLFPEFAEFAENVADQPWQNRMYFYSDVASEDKSFVPLGYSIRSKTEWLSGLLDSDGCVLNNNGSLQLQVASVDHGFIKDVQLLLQELGCHSSIKKVRDAGKYMLPKNDGTGELYECDCQDVYRINISTCSVNKLLTLGLNTRRLDLSGSKDCNREATRYTKVVSVEPAGKSDTFCFNEPERHMGMFNGVLTGQCSEIALPSTPDESFVCVLSSMNLEKYDEWKDTDAVEVLTAFLDSVVTEFLDRLHEMVLSSKEHRQMFQLMWRAYQFASKHRALGIGTLGWHSYLQKNMIAFESKEAAKLNVEMHRTINERAHKASQELADEYGEPTYLKGYGRRNTTLTAIAPTKSSSFILGQVSQGIEPEFSNFYIKGLAKARAVIKNPYLEKLLEMKERNTEEVWQSIKDKDGSVQHLPFLTDHEKDVFKTFSEINPTAVTTQAAARQPYVDQAQSLNLMIHPDIPIKDINQLYINAWRMGVKSLYYQYSTNAAQDLARKMNINECAACEA